MFDDVRDLIHDNLDYYFGHCDWFPDDDEEYAQLCAEATTECIRRLENDGHPCKKDGFMEDEANLELIDDFILDYIPRKYPGSIPICSFYDEGQDRKCHFVIDAIKAKNYK